MTASNGNGERFQVGRGDVVMVVSVVELHEQWLAFQAKIDSMPTELLLERAKMSRRSQDHLTWWSGVMAALTLLTGGGMSQDQAMHMFAAASLLEIADTE